MAQLKKKTDYSKSKFQGRIRIDKKQLKRLEKYKTTKTLAGYLDIILNAHWASMDTHKFEHYLLNQEK